jgi:hypothetical protein
LWPAMASTTLRLLPRPLSLARFGRRAGAGPCRRVFLGLQLAPMLDAVTTARKARSLMRQNLILAVIYNMFATRIAVIALVTPLIAAILSDDDFSELQ